jgi:hypothetical protein
MAADEVREDVQPYVALKDGVDIEAVTESAAQLSDAFAPGAHEGGESNA